MHIKYHQLRYDLIYEAFTNGDTIAMACFRHKISKTQYYHSCKALNKPSVCSIKGKKCTKPTIDPTIKPTNTVQDKSE